MAKTTPEDWDETASNNADINNIPLGEGVTRIPAFNDISRESMAQWARWLGDDTLASATTTDLGSVPGRYVTITGTVTITGLGTIKAGTIKYVRFSGALTLTHNDTSLILPTGANIATAAGDTAILVSEGSGNWRCLFYRGEGTTPAPVGQCRFDYVNSTTCRLTPFNGDRIKINGKIEKIPSAGVDLASTGLSASTVYFVYAYMNSGTMTLEASTTVPVISTTAGNVGVTIKTGDNTRTLVGMVYPPSSATFASTATSKLVLSWFNRRDIWLSTVLASNFSTTSSTPVEVPNTSVNRLQFLVWGDEPVPAILFAATANTASGNVTVPGVYYDNTGVAFGIAYNVSAANSSLPLNRGVPLNLTRGYHLLWPILSCTAGTATVFSGLELDALVKG